MIGSVAPARYPLASPFCADGPKSIAQHGLKTSCLFSKVKSNCTAYGKSNLSAGGSWVAIQCVHVTLHKGNDYRAKMKTPIAHIWKGFASNSKEVLFWEIQNVNFGVIKHKKDPLSRVLHP
jgi:hypothetical protein